MGPPVGVLLTSLAVAFFKQLLALYGSPVLRSSPHIGSFMARPICRFKAGDQARLVRPHPRHGGDWLLLQESCGRIVNIISRNANGQKWANGEHIVRYSCHVDGLPSRWAIYDVMLDPLGPPPRKLTRDDIVYRLHTPYGTSRLVGIPIRDYPALSAADIACIAHSGKLSSYEFQPSGTKTCIHTADFTMLCLGPYDPKLHHEKRRRRT